MSLVELASEFLPMIGILTVLVGFCVLLGGARTERLDAPEAMALMGLATNKSARCFVDREGRAALALDADGARVSAVFRLGLFLVVKHVPLARLRAHLRCGELHLSISGEPRTRVRLLVGDTFSAALAASLTQELRA